MTSNFEYHLLKDFPRLFGATTAERPQPSTGGIGRINCGEGWFLLIQLLCEQIQETVDASGSMAPTVMYIEEKFGVMRVACSGANVAVRTLISAAERASGSCCEACGALAQTARTKHGWIKTLCQNCIVAAEKNF
ncbi:hypothetical protein [Pseudomonas viridiflava]|uniref:hypothetical protein n=1 Tax=Pseudomonas viridiflava TaxID=33069 RepID=UPI0013CEC327|nr:hypothetical protein [Pseudomonas viridiflava]